MSNNFLLYLPKSGVMVLDRVMRHIESNERVVAPRKRRRLALGASLALLAAACSSAHSTTQSTLAPIGRAARTEAPAAPVATAAVATPSPETSPTTIATKVTVADTIATVVTTQAKAPNTPGITLAQAQGPSPSRFPSTSVGPVDTNPSTPICSFGGDAQPKSLHYDSNGVSLATGVVISRISTGEHKAATCSEWLVFQVDGQLDATGLPGVLAQSVNAPIKGAESGDVIKIKGNAFLQIVIGAALQDGAAKPVIDPGLSLIEDLKITGSSAGHTVITLGLDEAHPFKVEEVTGSMCPVKCLVLEVGADRLAA